MKYIYNNKKFREQRMYDSERTKYLEANDVKVIRFWNDEIENNLEAVLEKIYKLTPT